MQQKPWAWSREWLWNEVAWLGTLAGTLLLVLIWRSLCTVGREMAASLRSWRNLRLAQEWIELYTALAKAMWTATVVGFG